MPFVLRFQLEQKFARYMAKHWCPFKVSSCHATSNRLHQMQDDGRNEFASPFCTQRFVRRKRDKEDVASLVEDEVRGIEVELAKTRS